MLSGVAVAHLLFAQRTFDSARDRIPDPDDGTQENEGKRELKGNNHIDLRDFPLSTKD